MNSAICTLFENDYHYGVGALANSLHAQGFRGVIYVGYRGQPPPWAIGVKANSGTADFSPAEGLTLRFLPINTGIHLTNYKPDFMLSIWQEHCPNAESFFYFDPDITVMSRWSFFEEWVQAGIALCADINPSMPANHPIRHAWRRFYQQRGFTFRRDVEIYFNGGFFGLRREQLDFLTCWQHLQVLMAPEINGLENVNVRDRTFLFNKTDQDAMNIAAMSTESEISPMGQDGMDFQHGGGGYVMSHALGDRKPWRKDFIQNLFLHGGSPSRADKNFFRFATSPIRLYSSIALANKRLSLLMASFLGRFIKK